MGELHNATSPEAAARIARARAQANVITCFIAAIGTAASLIGMWPVTRAAVLAAGVPDDLVSPLALTALGLLEGTIIVCGLRARANVMETGRAGVDGMALWFAVSASATVSSAEAALAAPAGTPPGEQLVVVLVRLIAPITAGWLWERGLAPERRAADDHRPRIIATYMNRLRAHLLSRAGHADTSELHRRRAAARAARLADQLARADEQNLSLRQRWTLRRLRHAIRVSGAAHHVDQRNYLLNDIAATRHAFALTHIRPPSPWQHQTAAPHPQTIATLIPAPRRITAVEAPEKAEELPDGLRRSSEAAFFPSGREAFTTTELDIARRLFAEKKKTTGAHPSVNAVAKAINRRWERAKLVHAAVRAERGR